MYVNILTSEKSFKEKIKKIIAYFRKRRGARITWRQRHAKVYDENSGYMTPCSKGVEKKYKDLWGAFNSRLNMDTLRISANISGKADPRIVPEEIFVADIEPSLMVDPNLVFLSNKSYYNQRFPNGKFPADLLHLIDGQWYDRNFNRLEPEEWLSEIDTFIYPVVIKPSSDSYGGRGVYFAQEPKELIAHSRDMSDYVVQEKVEQHPFFESFHPTSINTIRVYLYRSVSDHQLHILSMDLTIGRSGSKVNNETVGGMYSGINENGTLVGYAVDKYGKRYEKHPDTGMSFDLTIPDIEGLKQFSLVLGKKMLPATLIGLDLFYDKKGEWKTMEVNTQSHSIRSAQYFGQPFFGEFTEEVIAYCKKNHWGLK